MIIHILGCRGYTSLVFDDVVGYRSVAALPLNSLYGQIKYDWMLIRTANHQAINESTLSNPFVFES